MTAYDIIYFWVARMIQMGLVDKRWDITSRDAEVPAWESLKEKDKDNFDLVTQDQILDVFNKITGAFFLVMIVLASVALLVGGIGVMAIMMVSVTDRTHDPRRELLG